MLGAPSMSAGICCQGYEQVLLSIARASRRGCVQARQKLSWAAITRRLAHWPRLPACQQTGREYFGRVLIPDAAVADEDGIRRRAQNVAARAAFTQPERQVVSVERRGKVLEVLTTSQKLAHRIAHELKKAFGGRTSYVWSADRTLLATWQPREVKRGSR